MARRVGANRRMKMVERKRKRPKKSRTLLRRLAGFVRVTACALFLGVLGFIGARRASGLVTSKNILKVKKVEVRGVEHIDTANVLALAAIQPGVSMLEVKCADIGKRIQKNPWVAKVRIRKKIPHTLGITVVERKPVALVNLGALYTVDKQGYLWPLASHTYWNLPLVSGLADTVTRKGHHLKPDQTERLNAFLDGMRRAARETTLRISQIDFSGSMGVHITLESSPLRATIRSSAVKKDIKNIQEIIRMAEEQSEAMPKYINCCFHNLAFVQ